MSNTLIIIIVIVVVIVIAFFFYRNCKVVCSSSESYTGKLDSNIDLYVVNKASGYAGIKYNVFIKAEPDIRATQMGLDAFEEKKIPFGKSVFVNQLIGLADIETSGDYARGWVSNRSKIDEIKQQAANLKYSNANVYVHVISNGGAGYYINDWHWSDRGNGSSNLIEYTTIDDITSGALGNDYGKKVRDICNADYTVAQASGYANLCTDFGKRLKTDVLRGAPSSIKTREEAIKNIIDGLYAKYNMYRTPVGPRKICFITPCKGMFE